MNVSAKVKLFINKTKEKGIRYSTKKAIQVIKSNFNKEEFVVPAGCRLSQKDHMHPIMKGAILRKDKYAIIISLYPYYENEGINRNAFIAKGLNRNGYKVAFYYCKDSYAKNQFVFQEDCCIHEPIQGEIKNNFEQICKDAKLLITSVPVQMVYDYMMLAKNKGIKVIFDNMMDWTSNRGMSVFNKELALKIGEVCDFITAPSKDLAINAEKTFNKNATIIENGCDINIFDIQKQCALPAYFNAAQKNYLFSGDFDTHCFDWSKVKEIVNKYPHYNFCVVGDVPVWIREQNGSMPANFLYLGNVSKSELSGLIKFCDGVIIPSLQKNNLLIDNTLIAIQAIAIGTPVFRLGEYGQDEIPESIDISNDSSILESYKKTDINHFERSIKNSLFNKTIELLEACNINERFNDYLSISIIILNYNNKNVIFKCIDRLIEFNSYNYEIVVVDNNSKDGSYDILEKEYKDKITLVKNIKNGCSSGRNLGVSVARGEYVMFFDSDQWPFTYNWLDSPIRTLLENDSIGMTGWAAGWLHFELWNIVGGITDGLFGNLLPCSYEYTTSIDYLGSGGMMLSKSLFNKIGGFDEFYDPTAFEDTDLSFRVKKAGKQVCFCPYTNIFHLGNQTTNSNDTNNTAFHAIFNRNMEYFRNIWNKKSIIEKDDSFKVVFVNRPTMFTQVGGDTIQLLKTKKYIEQNFSVQVQLCTSPEEMLLHPDADLFHIFNIQTMDQTENFIATAKNMNKPVALSPIFWDLSHGIYTYYLQRMGIYNLKPWMSNFKTPVLKFLGKFKNSNPYYSKTYIDRNRWMLQNVNLLLPNSEEEMEILQDKFGPIYVKYRSVPNAIEQKDYSQIDIKRKNNRVLVSGRIETVKNQYMLLEALYDLKDVEIVFLGRLNNHKYYNKLQELAEKRGNVKFIEEVPNNEVYKHYLEAKVHVLVSFRESPGLSTLEAAYFGCNVVFSDPRFTPVDYYELEQLGYMCNPYDKTSIRNAVLKALETNPAYDRELYFSRYSYEAAAEETYLAYCDLIDRRIK